MSLNTDQVLEVVREDYYDGPLSRISVVYLFAGSDLPGEIRLRTWIAPEIEEMQLLASTYEHCLARLRFWQDLLDKGELENYLGILEMQKDK